DLDFDHVVALGFDLCLAAEARGAAYVEGLVEDVELFVFDLRQLIEALGHVDVAGRTGAHAAAAVSLGRAGAFGRGQDRRPAWDGDFQLLSYESYDRHSVWLRPEVRLDTAGAL